MYVFIFVAILMGIIGVFIAKQVSAPIDVPVVTNDDTNVIMCTADAMQCPDGSYVGRTGPTCEFVCPKIDTVTPDDKSDLIKVDSPVSGGLVSSPLQISGSARGGWFFEASFPIVLEDGAGNQIAVGVATATSDWMTSEFVPFTANLVFTATTTTATGKLTLKKDNPSGLPENDDSYTIPVRFAP